MVANSIVYQDTVTMFNSSQAVSPPDVEAISEPQAPCLEPVNRNSITVDLKSLNGIIQDANRLSSFLDFADRQRREEVTVPEVMHKSVTDGLQESTDNQEGKFTDSPTSNSNTTGGKRTVNETTLYTVHHPFDAQRTSEMPANEDVSSRFDTSPALQSIRDNLPSAADGTGIDERNEIESLKTEHSRKGSESSIKENNTNLPGRNNREDDKVASNQTPPEPQPRRELTTAKRQFAPLNSTV